MDTRWSGVQQLSPRLDCALDCAQRDAVLHALGDHHAAGRLSVDELDRRVQAALGAETEGELAELTADLDDLAAQLQNQPLPASDAGPRTGFLSTSVSRWATAYVTLAGAGAFLATVGPRTNPAEFAAGATAALLGFGAHWALTRRGTDSAAV